ncbi:hypothetical protein [Methylophaga sp. OBS1]|uniref:hypothetical protein n=1 Tax=Methylophaga sp. OBS1 TaxID=2991933 RepID=UPI0022580910|nr:hypothetical protein [Methylophaga sp. OBS1]MCX4193329.1 hypothetical protein [Methylophaga sp. OBS1]
MSNRYLNRHVLLALAAIVLLLQSFAVWHDAEHAFHTAEAQCERLNAINHLPAADIYPELAFGIQTETSFFESSVYHAHLPATTRRQHAIRAPPVFS